MAFEDFDPIFCEPKVELSAHSSSPLRPFLLHGYAIDTSHIVIHVTDFHSITLEAHLSVPLLEDIRDIIGIGGSWSEFVDYFVASLKSEDLKLVMEANSNSDGASSAKLVVQKSKGMPLITIPLTKLEDSAASEAMSNLSLGLFKAFKSIKCSLVEEQEHSSRMTNMIAAEKERNETAQQQLEQRHKFQKISDSEKVNVSTNGQQNSPKHYSSSPGFIPTMIDENLVVYLAVGLQISKQLGMQVLPKLGIVCFQCIAGSK